MSKQTQLESLDKIKPHMANQDARVLEYVNANPRLSRAQLTKALGMRHSSLTRSVKSLIDKGLIFESGVTYDAETDRNVSVLSVVPYGIGPNGPQQER